MSTITRGARGIGAILMAATIVIVGMNLRLGLTSVGPLIPTIRGDLGMSGSTAGLLGTLPLLALGLVAPLAPALSGRFGAERVVLACLVGITGGLILRLAPGVVLLFAGTLVLGCCIAIGNILMPGIIRRHYGSGAPTMMGIYSVALTGAAALAAGVTVPIERLAGGSWRAALGAWAIPGLVAILAWLPHLRGSAPLERASGRGRVRVSLWRNGLAWNVTILMGTQSTIFYTIAAWMPEILHRHGLSNSYAGLALSVAMLVGIPAGLVVSYLAGRLADHRPTVLVGALATAAGLVWLLAAPTTLPLLMGVVFGIGMGANFALALSLIVLRSPDGDHVAELSRMAQSVGYGVAALGPVVAGALHDLTGNWTLPLAVVLALAVPELVCGLYASRPGVVRGVVTDPSLAGRPGGGDARQALTQDG